MRTAFVEIPHNDGFRQHNLGLDKATRDALAAYCRSEWPQHTAKMAAREWGLSLDEGRGLVAGRASQATVDKIWKHPRGGWAVVLPVMGAVIGLPVHEFFHQQINTAAQEARRAVEHEQLARAAYRRLAGISRRDGDDRDGAAPTGEARRSFGALGSEEARRLD